MKLYKKAVVVLLIMLLIATMLPMAAIAEPKAMATPIGKDDFKIKVGKTNINLLTSTSIDIHKAAKKKFVRVKNVWGDFDIAVKAKEATFMPWEKGDAYMSVAVLTKYGVTNRSIKIGSKEKDMLLTYPDPFSEHEADGVRYYRFVAPGAPFDDFSEELTERRLRDRPDWFYEIEIHVSVKTKKVVKIAFAEFLPWA